MNERRGTKGLELWCRKMTEGYPGVKIDNMTTSWRDGLAFCAIIHHFRPDLIDFSKLSKDDVYHNNELAFRIAEQFLGIPALLEPEDMVEYTVPDRLSILTYLSQFYQAFAVREGASPARLAPKRPQSTTDHGIVSPASTSPPTKVAYKGANLRREPCTKCGLPVFIAERLNIGKSLFHRTCFRCARCNSQLTLANYYETENNEYCCEICPDEEKLMSKTPAHKTVLQRSMSDEEKSANLKMVSNEPDEFSAIFENALENADIEKTMTLDREFNTAMSGFIQCQLVESSDSGNEESISKEEAEPPDLLHTSAQSRVHYDSGFPSKDVSVINSFRDNDESQNVVTKESVVKARMRLFENDFKADVHSKKVPLSPNASIPGSIKSVDNSVSENIEDTKHSKPQELHINGKNVSNLPTNHFTTSTLNKQDDSKEISSINTPDSSLEQTASDNVSKEISGLEQNNSNSKINEAIEMINSSISSLQNSAQLSYISKESSESISDKNYTPLSTEIESSKKNLTQDSSEDTFEKSYSKNYVSLSTKEETSKTNRTPTIDLQQSSELSKLESTDDSKIISPLAPEKDPTVENNSESDLKDSSLTIEENRDKPPDKVVETFNHVVKAPIEEEKVVETVNYRVKSKTREELPSTEDYKPKNYDFKPKDDDYKPKNYDSKPIDDDSKPIGDDSEQPVLEKEESYPDELNPFDEVEKSQQKASLNPFGSEDEEESPVELVKKPVPSPRFRRKISASDARKIMESPMRDVTTRRDINPFESDNENGEKPPVPATRKKKLICAPRINPWSDDDEQSDEGKTSTSMKMPVPSPRKSISSDSKRVSLNPFETSDNENDESVQAMRKKPNHPVINLNPWSDDEDGEQRRKVYLRNPSQSSDIKHNLLNSSHTFGSISSISSSNYGSARKKRPAPKPPIPGFLDGSNTSSLASTPTHSVPHSPKATPKYRKDRKAPPPPIFTSSPITVEKTEEKLQNTENGKDDLHKEKTVKDAVNRNRQSHNLQIDEDLNKLSPANKSTFGKWKRKKGRAPGKPIPERRILQYLPMAEIKKELEFIEIQQQGLEKQGVRLEQIIREKCEGTGTSATPDEDIPIEVEDLILQLFELVNEKNDLFRKQTELMYLRRQQRLEEEHADIEFQIRCLMMKPEANKTDSDKAREEELIKRLVEIVERRNDIVDCLEKDRVREAEEDDSISNHINLFTLNRDAQTEKLKSKTEVSKKEKKEKDKEKKKEKSKQKKGTIDVDKDVDEMETNISTLEKKKKKKFNIF